MCCTSTDLISSLHTRLGSLNEETHFITAAVLDPRYKMKWINDEAGKTRAKACIVEQMELHSTSSNATIDESLQIRDDSPINAESELLSFMEKDEVAATSASNELDTYLRDTTYNPLEYWQQNRLKYPRLYQLQVIHHSVPATSATVERYFSAAGYVCSARRNRLIPYLRVFLLLSATKT